MFEGEKKTIFCVSLIFLGFSSFILFTTIWNFTEYYDVYVYRNWSYIVPVIVGTVIFILIGLYMMKSDTKRIEV